jgi:hypothetical protein
MTRREEYVRELVASLEAVIEERQDLVRDLHELVRSPRLQVQQDQHGERLALQWRLERVSRAQERLLATLASLVPPKPKSRAGSAHLRSDDR